MRKTIELEKKKIPYTFRQNRRAKGVRLCVTSGGMFTVTAPPWMGQSRIERFILEKSEWILDKIRYVSRFPVQQVHRRPNRRKHFAEYKEKARTLVHERLAHFNQFYGFKWNKLAIRNQLSRWGSCSCRGNLNFNYKIAMLPPHLADYIIVHELCHLGELNHSPGFWALVSRAMPAHQRLRKELKRMSIVFS